MQLHAREQITLGSQVQITTDAANKWAKKLFYVFSVDYGIADTRAQSFSVLQQLSLQLWRTNTHHPI